MLKFIDFIRPVREEDCTKLIELGLNTGIFGPGEAEQLLGNTLQELLAGKLPLGHQAHVLDEGSELKGWIYLGPMDDSNIWNLWWIGVDPKYQRKGYGYTLLKFVEGIAIKSGAKQLFIETSSSPLLKRTRDFYTFQGYTVSHTERNAYGVGEDKIVFVKELQG